MLNEALAVLPLATSARANLQLSPSSRMSSSVGAPAVSGSRRMSAQRTKKPSIASRHAMARPMPEDEPVTMAQEGTCQVCQASASLARPWVSHSSRIAS